MILRRSCLRTKDHDMEKSSSIQDRFWSTSMLRFHMETIGLVQYPLILERISRHFSVNILLLRKDCAVMPVLARSLPNVAAKPFRRGFKKPGRSLSIWTPRYAPMSNIKEPCKHSPFHMGFVFAISHTSRKWTKLLLFSGSQ